MIGDPNSMNHSSTPSVALLCTHAWADSAVQESDSTRAATSGSFRETNVYGFDGLMAACWLSPQRCIQICPL